MFSRNNVNICIRDVPRYDIAGVVFVRSPRNLSAVPRAVTKCYKIFTSHRSREGSSACTVTMLRNALTNSSCVVGPPISHQKVRDRGLAASDQVV